MEKKKDNTALYIVYAAAAYFGLQFLLKPKRSQSAATVTYPITDPAVQAATLPTTATVQESIPAPAVKATWVAERFPLRKGMKGAKVKALQQKLGVSADGAFGNDTEAALLGRYGVSIVSQDLYKTIVTAFVKTTSSPKSSQTISTWVPESFPLRKGMKGGNIRTLQQKLGITADGAFGTGTEAAVIGRFGTPSVTEVQFRSLTQAQQATFNKLLESIVTKAVTTKDNSMVLQSGSKGPDVYRLQKWLGFKDKKSAKKGDPIADSNLGKQTLAALQKRTGKSSITINQLNDFIKPVSGIGYLGELLVTKRSATVLNSNLSPHRAVPGNTILGTRTMELTDPQARKAYTQFKTVDGFYRWVDKDAV